MIKSNADEKSGLKKLFSKIIGVEDISEIYTSIAAKVTKKYLIMMLIIYSCLIFKTIIIL